MQRQVEEEEEEPIRTTQFIGPNPLKLQMQFEPEDDEEEVEPAQTKRLDSLGVNVNPGIESSLDSAIGSVQKLPKSIRNFFEPRFGFDFSGVRIHTDSKAAEAAQSINAKAFTKGSNVVFGAGQYLPETIAGKHLLAHELTHVVQQSTTSDPSKIQRLGANPGCNRTQRKKIHNAIKKATKWLDNAIKALGARRLSRKTLKALRRNFGPTHGKAANARTIRNRLIAAKGALARNPFTCNQGTARLCKTNHCGFSHFGSNASTICANVTLTARRPWQFQAGCVLHETFHARYAKMIYDSYSGWNGYSSKSRGYPGAHPLWNADSYTTLAMDLS